MLCSICSIPVVLPSDQNKKSNYYAVFKDNDIICSACDDVHNLLKPSTIITKINLPINNDIKKTGIVCIKCKNIMTNSRCTCGFINPLFRR